MTEDPAAPEQSKGDATSSRLVQVIALLVLAGVAYLFRGPVILAADFYYKAGWMLLHAADAQSFPPKSKLCAKAFCTRIDTIKKNYLKLRGGVSLEVFGGTYCPMHAPQSPGDDRGTNSTWNILYFVFAFFMAYGMAFAAGWLLARLVPRVRPAVEGVSLFLAFLVWAAWVRW